MSENLLVILRERYPEGTVVELDHMSDIFADDMFKGLKGVVNHVDDNGTIHVTWENGRELGVILGEDSCHVIARRIEDDPDKVLERIKARFDEENDLTEKLGEIVWDMTSNDGNYTINIGSGLKRVLSRCRNGRDFKIADETVAAVCGYPLSLLIDTIDERDANAYEWNFR